MLRSHRVLAALVLVLASGARPGAAAATTDCDRHAGFEHLPRQPDTGGVFEITEYGAAIRACEPGKAEACALLARH